MKVGAIFRYEIGYRLRQPSTWIYGTLLFAVPLAMAHLSSPIGNRVVNAPLQYAEIVGILGFFAMFITAGIFGDAAMRDTSTGAQALFNTAPITKLDYLGGRFAASFVVNAVLLLLPAIGVLLSTLMPWLSHFNWAPFRLGAYLQPYLLFALPNLFLSAAVLFTVASLTRQALGMYLGALGLLVLYLVVINQGLGSDTIEIMLDSFGLGALQKITAHWPQAERTTRLIGYPPVLVANRALWVSLAVGLLAFLYARFSFVHAGMGGRNRSARDAVPERDERPARHAIATVPRATRGFDLRTRLVQVLAVARHALVDLLRNRAFILVAAGAVALVFLMGWDVGSVVFDTSTWPVTHLIAGEVMGVPMTIVFSVLTSLVAGELVWKEREVGAGDMAAVAPVPDWVPLAGRFLALVAVLVVMQAVLMASGTALQAIRGYYRFEPGLYVRILFGINLVEYLIFGALAMAVHVVMSQKNLAHVVVVGTYLFTLTAATFFGVRHNLLIYNGDPGWMYSDLNGFGPFVAPWAWLKAYWAAWALLLTTVATLFWVRSTEDGVGSRLRLARARLAGPAGRAAAVAGLLIVSLGGFVFYNTNVLNEYRTSKDGDALRAEYERMFKRYEEAAQPSIVKEELRIEIHPERRSADIDGTFRMVNASGRPVDTLLVLVDHDVALRNMELGVAATLVVDDSMRQHRVYALTRALQPGDSMTMRFHLRFAPRGFPNSHVPTDVVSNGAYFDRGWLPMIGYQSSLEVANEKTRKRLGLVPRAGLPSVRDSTYEVRRHDTRMGERVDMDVVIGTAGDQVAVTSGNLVREWADKDRRYFHYRTDVAIPDGAPFLSARYAVKEDSWQSPSGKIPSAGAGQRVPLRIYHHGTHTWNVDRIMRSMKASLDYYSAAFGPYPYSELRVVEFPRYASFARANPHTITFSEGSAFITRIDSGDVDRPFFVVAHETAHQWWGNQIRGARVQGVGMVSETLAQYGAMMVMETTFGQEMVRRFYDFEMERYLRGRAQSASREVPLADVESQPHLFYHKGAVAMYTLRELIGEDSVNLALRRFLAAHRDARPPYATSRDLVRELRAVTPDSMQSAITDLFDTITLWDVKTDSASAERTSGGDWKVTLTVTARKVRADSIGKETEVPMNDLVEIGVFGAPVGDRRGAELYLARQRVKSGMQRITVTVPARSGEPARAGADPFYKMIERDQTPSLVRVDRGS